MVKKLFETDGFTMYEPPDPESIKDLDPIVSISEKELPYIFAQWGFGRFNKFRMELNLTQIKLFSSRYLDTGKIKYRVCIDYQEHDGEFANKSVYDLNIPAGTDHKIVIDNLDRIIREIWGDDITRPKITDFRSCETIDDVLKVFGLDKSQIKKVMMRIPKKKRRK